MYSISEFAGLLVKQAREEKQWDQQYLADELDIDIRTLKKIEAGKSDHSVWKRSAPVSAPLSARAAITSST